MNPMQMKVVWQKLLPRLINCILAIWLPANRQTTQCGAENSPKYDLQFKIIRYLYKNTVN